MNQHGALDMTAVIGGYEIDDPDYRFGRLVALSIGPGDTLWFTRPR